MRLLPGSSEGATTLGLLVSLFVSDCAAVGVCVEAPASSVGVVAAAAVVVLVLVVAAAAVVLVVVVVIADVDDDVWYLFLQRLMI